MRKHRYGRCDIVLWNILDELSVCVDGMFVSECSHAHTSLVCELGSAHTACKLNSPEKIDQVHRKVADPKYDHNGTEHLGRSGSRVESAFVVHCEHEFAWPSDVG